MLVIIDNTYDNENDNNKLMIIVITMISWSKKKLYHVSTSNLYGYLVCIAANCFHDSIQDKIMCFG